MSPITSYTNTTSGSRNFIEPTYDNFTRTTQEMVLLPVSGQSFANATYTQNNSFPETSIYSLTADGSALYASYSPSTSYIYKSTNANNWTQYTAPGSYRYSVKYLGGIYLNFGGSNDGGINYSTNGTSWSAASIGAEAAASTSFIVYNSARSQFVAGCGSWVSPQVVRTSSNGSSWTASTIFNSGVGGYQGDTYIGTSGLNTSYAYLVVATTSSSSTVFKAAISQDATSWTDTNIISVCGTNSPRFILWINGSYWYGNSAYTVAKSNSSGLSYTTQNKSSLNLPASPERGDTFYYNNIQVAYISGSNEVSFSTDGLTWHKKSHSFGTLRNFCVSQNIVYCDNGSDFFALTL
jgi:hypothetical protein